MATAASAILVVVVGREREKRADLQHKRREEMTPVYEEFIKRVQNADQQREGVEEFYKGLQGELLLRGPAEVILAVQGWQSTESDDAASDTFAWEKVLQAIRKDLGFNDSALSRGDLLKVYINPDQVDYTLKHGRMPMVEAHDEDEET